jgi:transcriptional regulator with XRE-family HTH domain
MVLCGFVRGLRRVDELTEEQNSALVLRVREALARQRMSRQKLADTARISMSTLEKALNGSRPFTTPTIVRLEGALGISLRDSDTKPATARPDLGGYARAGVSWLEGSYLTLRPSFEVAGAIYAYRTLIGWDDAGGCLAFHEADRLDAPFAQKGVVSMPNKSGHIYLYTNDSGQMRLAVLGRPQISGAIYGVLTTLAAGPGSNLTPVAAPLALLPWASVASPVLGRITDGDPNYAAYHQHLAAIEQNGHAKLLAGH